MLNIEDILSYRYFSHKSEERKIVGYAKMANFRIPVPMPQEKINTIDTQEEDNLYKVMSLYPDDIFESEEELYKKIAEEYDMKKLQQMDLTKILATLCDKGVLEQSEFLPACGPIPVFQDGVPGDSDHPMTGWDETPMPNVLDNYKKKYADYINKYCQNVSPATAAILQEAMAVHNKVDEILHKIQSYR